MRTRYLASSLIAVALAASVRAATPVVYTNTSNLLPNTPNQVLQIYVTGTDAIQGENLNFQINSGASGPILTGVNIIAGTIFAASNNGQGFPNDTTNFNSQGIYINGTLSGHLAVVLTTTIGNAVATDNGLLATLLISTSATTGSAFTLNMINTLNGRSIFGTGGNGTLGFLYPHNQISIGTADRQWNINGGGAWDSDPNWSPFAPYASGDIANFLGALTSGTAVVTLDGQRTVGTINFNNTAGSYDLQPGSGGSLKLDNGTLSAAIASQAGIHSISAPVALAADTTVSVAAGSTLTLSGGISGTSSALALTGTGKLILNGANSYGATSIAAGSTLQVGNGTTNGSLGTASITNNGLLNLASLALPIAVPMSGSGTVTISGFVGLNNTSTADTMIIMPTGTLQIGSGGTSGALNGTSVLDNGQLIFNRSDAAVQNTLITGAGTLTQAGPGTTTLTAVANYSGPTIPSAGLLDFSGGVTHAIGAVTLGGNLMVEGGTTVVSKGLNGTSSASVWSIAGTYQLAQGSQAAGTTKVYAVPTFTGTGTLDLTDNKLIVESTGGTGNKSTLISSLNTLVAQGSNGGTWTGNGITSSTAAADVGTLKTTIAVVDNGEYASPKTTFGGTAVDPSSILVTRALVGDANLDNVVDSADYVVLATHFTATNANWAMGDFNGDGVVNSADFVILATNFTATLPGGFSLQPADTFSAPAGGGSSTQAVPEPASLALMAAGTLLFLRRKPRAPARRLCTFQERKA